jgi:hypothetical protein
MAKNPNSEGSSLSEPEWIFPYHIMGIGDSFFIPTMRPSKMTYAVEITAKRAGVSVKCFPTTKDKILGVRVWRIG